MSSRRAQSLPPNFVEKHRRSRCTAAICFSWKVFTCIVSHVTLVSLVVAYCIGGALLFQHLEQENELEVKREAKHVRENITDMLWALTEEEEVLREENWTKKAEFKLQEFEKEILTLMKSRGWDGEDGEVHTQWTFFGALFYSIIVITTIGYGHIAPRTSWGKVTTIFYAILGIPLMLLCLSNIGDVLASSFRFLYWRVCCFLCTREPRRPRRNRHNRSSFRHQSHRFQSRSQPPPTIRRSVRTSQRSGDSGFGTGGGYEAGLFHAHSDPELRYTTSFEPDHFHHQKQRNTDQNLYREYEVDEKDRNFNQTYRNSRFSNRMKIRDRLRDRHTVDRDRNIRRRSMELMNEMEIQSTGKRAQSQKSMMRMPSVNREPLNRVRSQTLPIRGHHHQQQQQQQQHYQQQQLQSQQQQQQQQRSASKFRSKSVDPRTMRYLEVNEDDCKAPIYCNKYAFDYLERRDSIVRESRRGSIPKTPTTQHRGLQHQQPSHQSHSRYGNRLELPQLTMPPSVPRFSRYDDYEDDFEDAIEMLPPVREQRQRHHYGHHQHPVPPPPRRDRAVPLPPSPRIMSPMGFAVRRQTRPTVQDDDSYYDDDWGSYGDISARNRPVPIWLCVFLVISYIIAGAFLFAEWEKWTFLDSAYFCFITLTTIGFGDFVPAQGVKDNSKESIALCSLYLLFGISLLAMSFNLVQEEVIANVKDVARRLGILKEEEIDD